MRLRFALSILAIGLLASPLIAQHPLPSGVVRRPLDSSLARTRSATDNRPSKKPYVITGAVLGAAVTIVGLSFFASVSSPDVLISPAVVAGGLIGASGGYLVYRLRF